MTSGTVLSVANGRGSVSHRGVLFAGELPGGLPITETPISKNLAKDEAEWPHC